MMFGRQKGGGLCPLAGWLQTSEGTGSDFLRLQDSLSSHGAAGSCAFDAASGTFLVSGQGELPSLTDFLQHS